MRKLVLLAAVVGLGALSWIRSGRGPDGLLDLNVNNMPLPEVVELLKRRSGERIVAAKKLDARITLSLRKQTLETILARVAEQAGAVSVLALPIFSDESSMKELEAWFESGSGAKRWTNTTNLFSGDRQMMYFRDPRDPEPLVTLSLTNQLAVDAAALISQGVGAHVLLEDQQKSRVSLALKEASANQAASLLAAQLGKKSGPLYALQPRPKQLALISAGQTEVRETSGNQERIVRKGAGPGDRARMEKLAAMSPDERTAFLKEDFNNRAAARMLDRLRNQTPEQRVDQLRDRGRGEEIEVR